MARLLDLDKKEAEWQDEIKEYMNKTIDYDNTITQTQKLKQEAVDEIEKRRLWIRTAREMFGLNTTNLEEDTGTTAQMKTRADDILRRYEDLKIPEAVEKLLKECAPQRLTVTEMANRLKAGGIKTESTDFRNVLQNRLHSIRKKAEWLKVEKEKGENYYSYKS